MFAKKNWIGVLAIVIVGFSGMAQAETIYNFNFNTANGANSVNMDGKSFSTLMAPHAYTGTVWNQNATALGGGAASIGTIALTSSDNVNTGATVAISGVAKGYGLYKGSVLGPSTMPALQGYAYLESWVNPPPAWPYTLTFSNLGAGTKWELYFFTCGNPNDGGNDSFSAGDETKVAVRLGGSPSDVTWVEGKSYLHFANSGGTGIAAPSMIWRRASMP